MAQVQLDLRILELDLRFRGGLWLSPPLKFSSPIGLRPRPPLNLKTNSKVLKSYCKPSDFGFFLLVLSSQVHNWSWGLGCWRSTNLGKKSWYLFKRRKLSVSILANIRLQSQTQDQHFWIMKRIRKNRSRVCCLNTLTHTCYSK